MTALYDSSADENRGEYDSFIPLDFHLKVPKYSMPEDTHDEQTVYKLILDELMLDGRARQNLATFCTTWESNEVRKLMDLSITKNMVDRDEYPQTAEIERRCVHILADLWNSPQALSTIGTSTTGSSEAAMLSGLAFKWKWRQRQDDNGDASGQPNLVTGSVQVCWQKFAKYFDVELRELPMEEGRYTLDPDKVAAACDENTIGVVTTLGLTFTGHYDDVESVSSALDKLQAETGWDIPIHVDAASGGFIAPFLHPQLKWDFRLQRVKSINASGHKYGLAPLGVGWAVWREAEDLPEDLVFNVNYLGGSMPTFALNFSRPGGQIVAQYYNFLRLGRQGYTSVMRDLRDIAQFIAKALNSMRVFRVIHGGEAGLPVVTWTVSDEMELPFTLSDLSHELRSSGWQVPAYSLPANLDCKIVARVVVRYGFTHDLAASFIEDVRNALEYFQNHFPAYSLDTKEEHGFNHN
ncbi:glutamate decarboxylase [Alicyclobacillus sp. SO9]|uniref:glutamate decarboxylase n=1 Tax=Alicyclobacillus sp. SO9 TaxID=2665646 RepID=UPI0018E81F69|nr:glutamate decarboxylase [Alicyclobacillus sp. SO9]QQE78920.1 glutamate decarboxylase [Alicyclobacillus sp. SO9]